MITEIPVTKSELDASKERIKAQIADAIRNPGSYQLDALVKLTSALNVLSMFKAAE